MTHQQGATEGTGSVWGVQGIDGGKICVGSQDEYTWASGRGATDLDNLGRRGRDVDLSNGLFCKGRPMEVPGGGMPGPSSNKDIDTGSLPIPSCPGYCGYSGRETSPTHDVPDVTC